MLPPDAARTAELLARGENAAFGTGALVVKEGRDSELLSRDRANCASPTSSPGPKGPLSVPHDPSRCSSPATRSPYGSDCRSRCPAEPGDLALLLRQVHALPAPGFTLPPLDLLGGMERWLRLAGNAIQAR